MAGIFIDPAESFSKALGQGLSVFKGYRDEQRQDEDRAFVKDQALFDRKMKEEMFKLTQEEFGMKKNEFDYGVSRRGFNERVQQAELDGVLLGNEGKKIDNEWKPKLNKETIRASRDQSSQGWARINLARQEAAERRAAARRADAEAARRKSDNLGYAALVQAFGNPTEENLRKLYGNPAAARAITNFAAASTQSAAVQEAMMNPFGDWIKDPKKLKAVQSYARLTPVVNATADKHGLKRGARVDGFRYEQGKDERGRPVNLIRMTLVGNTKNGKPFRGDFLAKPEQLFETAGMATNIFGTISKDTVAQAKLGRLFNQTNPKMANEIVANEIAVLKDQLKYMEEGPERNEIQFRLLGLLNADAEVTGHTIFRRLGSIATSD